MKLTEVAKVAAPTAAALDEHSDSEDEGATGRGSSADEASCCHTNVSGRERSAIKRSTLLLCIFKNNRGAGCRHCHNCYLFTALGWLLFVVCRESLFFTRKSS